ncbi:hypothetical protein GCM10029978_028900 [Actinoallomurus acanthiterrae]
MLLGLTSPVTWQLGRVLLGRSRLLGLVSLLSLALLGGLLRLALLGGLLSQVLLGRSGLLGLLGLLCRVLLCRSCLLGLLLLGGSHLGLMGPLSRLLLGGVRRLRGVLCSMRRPLGALRLLW